MIPTYTHILRINWGGTWEGYLAGGRGCWPLTFAPNSDFSVGGGLSTHPQGSVSRALSVNGAGRPFLMFIRNGLVWLLNVVLYPYFCGQPITVERVLGKSCFDQTDLYRDLSVYLFCNHGQHLLGTLSGFGTREVCVCVCVCMCV